MSDSISTRETIVESIKALPVADQWAVMESALKALKTASKSVKTKKEKDPNAPKKEATWWVKRTCEVREHLKDTIAAENTDRKSRGENALPAIVAVRVSSMLRDAGKLTQEIMASHDDILATWTSFLASPPEPKPKSVKKSEPKASKETKVKKVMTEEEKAAKKESTKARKAEKKEPTSTLVTELFGKEDSKEETETEVAPYEWKFDFGKGEMTYERLDYEGKAYIYDNNTKAYLGLFMDKLKKLNKTIADPLA